MSERIDMWRAPDGTMFRSEAACLEYEQERADAAAANELLESGANLLDVLTRANQSRPWWRVSDDERALLSRMTKDTGLRVRHWQASDRPGYKFCSVRHDGSIHLFGDAGCWSGPYGNQVPLGDFLRYAKDTPGLAVVTSEVAR